MATDENISGSEKLSRLTKQLLQVEISANLKNELLVNIVQDLRSSLLLLQQPISNIDEEDTLESSSGEQQLIDKLKDRVDQLSKIVERLDDVRNLPVHYGKLETTEVELCSLVRRYAGFFKSRADQRNIELVTRLPDYSIVQKADLEKFQKMLVIMLSNAIQLTKEGSQVNIILQDKFESIQLSVEDSGTGLTSKEIDNLLYDPESGERIDTSKTEKNIDVRLSILKKLAELHDGELTIESEVDEGTTVTVTLPKKFLDTKIEKDENHGENDKRQNVTDEVGPLPLIESEKELDETVLVIEDNRNIRKYITVLLSREGLKVEVANNGVEAQKKLSVNKPDLVITDIMMPEMDGYEFVEKFRSDPENQLIPVIMVSVKTEVEARVQGFQIGICDYMIKPFNELELKARVQNLLKQKYEREKYFSNSEVEGVKPRERSLVEQLKNYIGNNITNETITINELSQSVNTSRRQLYRDLKVTTGFTPAEFVREVKLREARQLLERSPKIRVAEVAHKIGYRTTSHFSKIFKKRFGRNPSEYK